MKFVTQSHDVKKLMNASAILFLMNLLCFVTDGETEAAAVICASFAWKGHAALLLHRPISTSGSLFLHDNCAESRETNFLLEPRLWTEAAQFQ